MITGAKVSGTITGISGATYNVHELEFDNESYHFTYGSYSQDVTKDIKFADKLLLVPDLDQKKELLRVSSESGHYTPGGSTPLEESTAVILADQLTTDPLAAPLQALSNGFDEVIKNSGVRKFALLGFLGLAIYFIVKK